MTDKKQENVTAIEPARNENIATYETASGALAAAAKATVEARFVLALRRPRDIEDVRIRLLKDCRRPRFAEAARYRKPVGTKFDKHSGEWIEQYVEGPSARFAEASLRHLGNISVESPVIFDDERQRIHRVSATDLETNATTSADVNVMKTVERRKLKRNQRPLRTRTNSYGDLLYIVEATDDEVANKAASAVSKMRRNLILQLVPADILEECMDECIETQQARDREDPDAARRRVLDAFAEIGVSPPELGEYLGHDTNSMNPAELAGLRAVYAAIRDSETTWREVLDTRRGDTQEDAKPTAQQKKTQEIIDRHTQRGGKAKDSKPKPANGPKPSAGPPPVPPADDEDDAQPYADPEDDGR